VIVTNIVSVTISNVDRAILTVILNLPFKLNQNVSRVCLAMALYQQ
jgi:hypothetical protein